MKIKIKDSGVAVAIPVRREPSFQSIGSVALRVVEKLEQQRRDDDKAA